MTSDEAKKVVINFFKTLLLVDIGWAAILATLQSLILGQAGVSIGASGVATTVAVGTSWIMTFVLGLFQGALLLFFIMLIWGGWFYFYRLVTHTLDRGAQQAIAMVFLGVGALDVLWGVLQGLYSAAIVAGIGSAPAVSASMPVLISASVLSFIVSFGIGLFFAAVALTVLAAFGIVGMIIWSWFTKK